jgi:hypothetical protein
MITANHAQIPTLPRHKTTTTGGSFAGGVFAAASGERHRLASRRDDGARSRRRERLAGRRSVRFRFRFASYVCRYVSCVVRSYSVCRVESRVSAFFNNSFRFLVGGYWSLESSESATIVALGNNGMFAWKSNIVGNDNNNHDRHCA